VEQLNIYFENIIPYYPEGSYVDIECSYGRHYKDFWRLETGGAKNDYGDIPVEPFPLTINLRYFNGKIIASATTMIQLISKIICKETTVMCIGDSMTRAAGYVRHIQQILPNLNIIGTRTYDGLLYTEGRGGWRTVGEYGYATCETSPFVFPKDIAGDKYFGNCDFWKKVLFEDPEGYDYMGFQKIAHDEKGNKIYDKNGLPVKPKEGDAVYKPSAPDGGRLLMWEDASWKTMSRAPMWEFNFAKYMKHNREALVKDNDNIL
jgi:hypothetical protein